MKKLLKTIGWIIHHSTDDLREISNYCPELKYREYRIYRKHRVLGIAVYVFEAFFTDLGDGEFRRQQYYDNINIKKLINK